MGGFTTAVRSVDGAVVVSVRGELDVATAADFASSTSDVAGQAGPLVVDLSDCTFLDSSGFRTVGLLVRGTGRPRAVASPPQVRGVRRVIDLLGLRALAPVTDSLPAALLACSSPVEETA